MTTWLDFRTEPVSQRPEIEILFVGANEHNISIYAANCPVENCEWSDVTSDVQGLEADVESHATWHENGCPL